MKVKHVACLAFLLNTILFGTYYAIAKEALGHIDPIIFTFLEMVSLVPAALCILVCTRRQMTRAVFRHGILLGSSLCLAFFTIAIALKYTTATSTAFFPSLNGFLAAFIAWIFLRHPISRVTWLAGLISVVGTILLIANASIGGLRGSMIAFLGGVFFTSYVFLSDHEQKDVQAPWALFGVELLTSALWASLVALLFGDWNTFHLVLPKDVGIILYVAVACTFLPTMIAVLMQKHVSPVTVSFIYILEPIIGAVVASFYLHEILPLNGYLGGGLVVVGALVHTWGSARQAADEQSVRRILSLPSQAARASVLGLLLSPLLIFAAGGLLLYKLSGMPVLFWSDLYHFGLWLPELAREGQGGMAMLMTARALCWLIAWVLLVIMVYRAASRAIKTVRKHMVFMSPREQMTFDARVLRHMGVTPYARASLRRKELGKKMDKPLVQRRRRDREVRLSGVEFVES